MTMLHAIQKIQNHVRGFIARKAVMKRRRTKAAVRVQSRVCQKPHHNLWIFNMHHCNTLYEYTVQHSFNTLSRLFNIHSIIQHPLKSSLPYHPFSTVEKTLRCSTLHCISPCPYHLTKSLSWRSCTSNGVSYETYS